MQRKSSGNVYNSMLLSLSSADVCAGTPAAAQGPTLWLQALFHCRHFSSYFAMPGTSSAQKPSATQTHYRSTRTMIQRHGARSVRSRRLKHEGSECQHVDCDYDRVQQGCRLAGTGPVSQLLEVRHFRRRVVPCHNSTIISKPMTVLSCRPAESDAEVEELSMRLNKTALT